MNKDWTGNKKSTFATLGASSHSKGEREEHDYYATQPDCADDIIPYLTRNCVWEPASGEDHLANRLRGKGINVISTDLVKRLPETVQADFLTMQEKIKQRDIVTNPPYKYAEEFIRKSLELVDDGACVAMFLKLTFLEGQKRRKLFEEFPPRYVLVYSQRKKCAKNGDFENTGSSAAAYAWFVWYKGDNMPPEIRWI